LGALVVDQGSFFDRIDELDERIGGGHLVGDVHVDQAYAFNQHEGYWVTGPNAGKRLDNGGHLHYLSGPLFAHADQYFGEIADRVLDEGPVEPMIDNVKNLITQVLIDAPVRFDNLRRSAAGTVTDNGDMAWHQPAEVPRLSAQELAAERRGEGKSRRWNPSGEIRHGRAAP